MINMSKSNRWTYIYPKKGFAALINDRVYHDFPTDYMLREKKSRVLAAFKKKR